jgi:hypothetical protein
VINLKQLKELVQESHNYTETKIVSLSKTLIDYINTEELGMAYSVLHEGRNKVFQKHDKLIEQLLFMKNGIAHKKTVYNLFHILFQLYPNITALMREKLGMQKEFNRRSLKKLINEHISYIDEASVDRLKQADLVAQIDSEREIVKESLNYYLTVTRALKPAPSSD